jgi:GAF domain-containing protein/biotin carboxyl carrier protein
MLSRERLEALLQASQAFNSTIDLDQLLPRLLDLTLKVTESEAGALWVADGDGMRCAHAAGAAAARLVGRSLSAGHGAVEEVLRTQAPVVVADALDDPRFAAYSDAATGFRTRSVVTIPLVTGGAVLGAMELVNDIGGKDLFDDTDVAFLEMLADDAAAALRNARLYDAERRARDLKALLDVSHEITSTFDTERVLISVVNLAGRAVRFDRCVIATWDGGELRVRAVSGEEKVDRKAQSIRQLESFLAWSAEHQGALELRDVSGTDRLAATTRALFSTYLATSGAAALLVLPVRDAEGELGRLLFEFHSPGTLQDWMREAAELLANEVALALRNAQLYANVPFIAFLEPLAKKRRQLLALPRATLLRYALFAIIIAGVLLFVRPPLRVTAREALVHAAVQRPARAGAEGIITDVLVRDGDRVDAAQQIAYLRNEDLLLRLTATDGDLRAAEQRHLAAVARGNAGDAAAAQARAVQLRAALALLQTEADALVVRAPAAGIVLTPRLEEGIGSHREAGEPVAWIGDAEWAEIRLRVAQHDIGAVREGDRVRVRAAARPDVRYEGLVQAISPLADDLNGQPVYTVRALLDNRDSALRPGMSAAARILTEPRPLGYLLLRRPWRWIRMHLWY